MSTRLRMILVTVMILGLGLALSLWCKPATAQPGRWSAQRLCAGVSAQGAVYDWHDGRDNASGFLPQAWASFSLTSRASLAGSFERDFTEQMNVYRGGARFQVQGEKPEDRVHAFIGADYVGRSGEGSAAYEQKDTWGAVISAAWTAAKKADRDILWVIGSGQYEPENAITVWRLGLRWQL